MQEALLREVALTRSYLTGEKIESIYFGGGTPSILSAAYISSMLNKIMEHHDVSDDAEVTLEANPDDLSSTYLAEIAKIGINRLSIGIQSFRDEDLELMNRSHSARQAQRCVEAAHAAGITNINCDLIYGLPNLNDEAWAENLKVVLALKPTHLSVYSLTIEKNTAFHAWARNGKIKVPSSDQQADQFLIARKALIAAGFEHYEISNYAKPGFYSKHNASYWLGKKYLGLGASAHSYNVQSRQWNVANNRQYIDSIMDGFVPREIERITPAIGFNEYVLTSLRTSWGADLNHIEKTFGKQLSDYFEDLAKPRIDTGLITCKDRNYTLTEAGFLVADRIAADLFTEQKHD